MSILIATLVVYKGLCEINKSDVICTDEDPGLRIKSFAIIKIRGVLTNYNYIVYRHANLQRTYKLWFVQTPRIFIIAKVDLHL